MKIIRAKDYNDMSRKAANIISAQVILKPESVLGLATGSSPIGIYEQLIKWYHKGDVDFGACTTFNLDEYRGLTPDHDQSYHYFMHKNFFDAVNVPNERINLPDGAQLDAERECRRYDAAIRAAGGIDLQLLGMGLNGHIGFNEPNTMGVQTIMLARRIVLVVSGENKAKTVREAFFGPVTPRVPASILQLHTDVSIVADEAALSLCTDLL